MTATIAPADAPVAVLDMGASAIRLVIAEIPSRGTIRIIEEASRGVLLGRDAFSTGTIGARTVDEAVIALEGFSAIMRSYGVGNVRAVATSATREARNRDLFLDRLRSRTGIEFEVINEAEESRLVFLALQHALGRHAAFKGAWTLLVEVGGGSTSLTLLRRGQPNRSAVYALGSVRLRQQLNLRRHSHELQVALLKRYIANVIDEIRLDIPLRRITHMIAIGGDVRFAASQIADGDVDNGARDVESERLLAFCDEVAGLDEDGVVDRFRLPPVEAATLMPALLVYRTLLGETSARRVVVSDASLRAGVLLDLANADAPAGAEAFEQQVLASAEAVGHKYRFDRDHGRQVAGLAVRLFDELQPEHGLGTRERLLLQVAALLHDIGMYVSLRAHHKHSQYILAASQIFGLSDEETALISNVARYHRGGAPQRSHLPFVALDRQDQLTAIKLSAILRLANALDAEHLQKVKDVRLVRGTRSWTLELSGNGDLTMEQQAGTARSDMFEETFGRPVILRPVGVLL
jgi:exopolyphosphatase/guanosine-5'-triphosphate,3'-diphosphate pyrophosphatase